MTDKQILDWQEKVRSSFGNEARLYEYLFETMDNFYYRYLETTVNKDLKTQNLRDHVWGARSEETSMVDALKIQNETARKGIIEMAKAVPKARGPKVQYELVAEVRELSADHGSITFTARINWGHQDFAANPAGTKKSVKFEYEDLAQFRKSLALKLEDVCEIFL